MPDSLSAAARREWTRVVGLLANRNMLDALDESVLEQYAICHDRLRQAERDIAERGLLVPGDRGEVKNPSCQLGRQYRDQLVTLARELGLTPNARLRMAVEPEEADDGPGSFHAFAVQGLPDKEGVQ